jgi:hypothetical protein
MTNLLGVRLRLFGDIQDYDLIGSLFGARPMTPIGADGRWILYDPATEPLPERQPILDIRQHDIENAVRLRYEVRGWAHFEAAPNTLLEAAGFAVDLRSSLVNHFYSTGDVRSDSLENLLKQDLESQVSAVRGALRDVGLTTRKLVVQITVDQPSFPELVSELLAHFAGCCAQVGESKAIVQTNVSNIDTTIIASAANSDDRSDDGFWYKYWQTCRAYRHLLQYAVELADQSKAALGEAVQFSPAQPERKAAIRRCLELRAQLLSVRDDFRTFALSRRVCQATSEVVQR